MSKIVENLSHPANDATNKSHPGKTSAKSTLSDADNETIINSISGYDNDLVYRLEKLEREAERQARQIELNECLGYVAQLVDLFKHTVITSELEKQNDWHNETQNTFQNSKGSTGNRLLDDRVEKIVLSKGLTKEQWNCLLYMALNMGDIVEINKISKKHLQRIHDMVLRLLEDEEQIAVFALINAIDTHMAKKHFTEK